MGVVVVIVVVLKVVVVVVVVVVAAAAAAVAVVVGLAVTRCYALNYKEVQISSGHKSSWSYIVLQC